MEKYLLVNWIDGMKINKDHFIATENALLEKINNIATANLHLMNYGLLPVYNSNNHLSEIDIQIDSRSTLSVKIENLSAVTLGGVHIDISQKDNTAVELTYNLQEDLSVDRSYMIVLSASPFSREATGDADPDEEPPRRPFVVQKYQLHLMPASTMGNDMYLGPFHLPIGKLDVVSGKVLLDNQYIPPCLSLNSHKQLSSIYKDNIRLFNDLEHYCSIIINKIYAKKQSGLLVDIILTLSNNLHGYLNQHLPFMKRSMAFAPPVKLIESIESIGRIIKAIIDTRQNCGKEELLNYLSDWCNLNQASFEQLVADVVGANYNHSNMAVIFKTAGKLIEVLADLFKKLSELDYIGDQGDAHVFVTEEEEKPQKKRFSLKK